jgi:hypothetical protein
MKALSTAGLQMAEDDQSAVTINEFIDMMGILKRDAAYRRLEALVEQGLATRTHKWTTRRDGKRFQLVAYKLADQKAGTRRAKPR